MKICFRLELEDYRDAFRATNAKNRLITEITFLVMALTGSVAMLQSPHIPGGHAVIAIILLWLVTLGLLFASRWLSELAFRRPYRTELTRELEISEDGIESGQPPQKDQWRRFSKYMESASAFILYEGNSICAILPKRACDPEGIETLRRILAAKLPKR